MVRLALCLANTADMKLFRNQYPAMGDKESTNPVPHLCLAHLNFSVKLHDKFIIGKEFSDKEESTFRQARNLNSLVLLPGVATMKVSSFNLCISGKHLPITMAGN